MTRDDAPERWEDPGFALEQQGEAWVLRGELTVRSLGEAMPRLLALDDGPLALNFSALKRFDTAGAWAILQLREKLHSIGHELQLQGLSPEHEALIARVEQAVPTPPEDERRRFDIRDLLAAVGQAVVGVGRFMAEILAMLGVFLARLAWLARHPSQFRLTSLVYHADQVGWRAVPIVSLMAFLIGVVLAFQGAVQLRQFGAEIFVVDLIAISILRELGILLTAIIVAGRTASSFTAAIGSMKMREEIDAMNTLAIDPATVLFVPRILALLITLPILGMVANAMGLLGGALMSWIELGISPAMFLTRLIEDTSLDHVLVGFVKAPVFAIIIGVIGCHAGMQVGGNAESLGRQTSSAVVRAIFAVILADALFSVFFAMMEI
ncbi:MlaE family lipid ABC transporter permease subunit [Roseinatronobacter sp. HJB301]|uniref:MlaE family lipid ABC transporter permease subunit n=1 Tax=Roseinatronobacter alkalisoli TaxID=3028235 RepID=A0ABT5TBR8_9RHOB|nr:MlaE family lipid ABC transporter permease subunit [Roseinatronobacter sp. HJB301]